MNRYFKIVLKITSIFFLFLCIYTIYSFSFPYLVGNSNFKPCSDEEVEIYILTNGVHTDLVLPIAHPIKNWRTLLNPTETKSGDVFVNYAAFGWGDKGFYLETPTWSDLKFTTAFKALFFLSSTAMHVTFYKELKESKSCKKICISKEGYQELVKYVEDSFAKKDGLTNLIEGASYSRNDVFYNANDTYSLFTTCNTWSNNGLKEAGVNVF